MIKIQILTADLREMKGVGKTSGKPYHMRIQTGYAFTVGNDGAVAPFPDKFEIALEETQQPFQPGVYTLAPNSVYVNRDGRLEMRPRLFAVKG